MAVGARNAYCSYGVVLSSHDVVDCRASNRKPPSDFGLCRTAAHRSFYGNNVIGAELGAKRLMPTPLPTFSDFVCHVEGGVTKKQMQWAAAEWSVAGVQYEHALWHGTIGQQEGYAVSALAVFLDADQAVLTVSTASPKPAWAKPRDVLWRWPAVVQEGPKPFGGAYGQHTARLWEHQDSPPGVTSSLALERQAALHYMLEACQ